MLDRTSTALKGMIALQPSLAPIAAFAYNPV
jgi:hypothetical protein